MKEKDGKDRIIKSPIYQTILIGRMKEVEQVSSKSNKSDVNLFSLSSKRKYLQPQCFGMHD